MHRLSSLGLWLPTSWGFALFGLVILGIASICTAEEDDTNAIRRTAQQYIAALQQGDSATLVATWTAEGDFVDSTGVRTRGRDLVAHVAAMKERRSAPRGSEVTVDAIRFIKPDVAIEDGSVVSPQEEHAASFRYSAVWVKREGKWLLDSVRESAGGEAGHVDHLQPLVWLIGDWEEQGANGKVELNCRKSADGNYLLREIIIQTPEGATHNVSQRLGWDAAKKQITAWTFDSDGGHSVGVWVAKGEQWLVHSEGVLPNGQTVSTMSVYTRHGNDSFTWESKQQGGAGGASANRKVTFNRSQPTEKTNSRNR